MVQRPPYDPDMPPPGGFDPRYADGGSGPRPDRARRFPDEEPRFGRERPVDDPFDPRGQRGPVARRPGMSRSTIILLALGGLLLLGAIIFGLSLGRSGPGSDSLDNAAGEETAATSPEQRCASPATYDLLKRELFRQAAAARGADQAAFDRLAAYAALRVTEPVLKSGGEDGETRISCGADVALDLPPGVQVVGGRRTLSTSLTYDLQPAADRTGDVMTLSGAEAIVTPLATLARTGNASSPATPPAALPEPAGTPEAPIAPSVPAPAPVPVSPPRPPEPAPVTEGAARPSFNCARARTSGEKAVCRSDSLAALDRQMASFYVAALRDANGEQRALLQRTRDRFLAYRDRCTSDRCIADSYRGRISEIRDIVDGRWRGQ